MDFGEKLRLARLGHRMTLAKLSEKSGVSKSLLSMIERGQSVPTITTFQKIAAALEIPASTLFADNGSGSPRLSRNLDNCGMDRGEVFSLSNSRQDGVPPLGVRVVRKDRRKKMIMPWGAHYQMLCPDLQHKIELIYLTYPVGTSTGELYSHKGEECGVVLEGRFKGVIGDQEVILQPGDSIYYDSSIPHRWENAGDIEVKAIWAITPPSF